MNSLFFVLFAMGACSPTATPTREVTAPPSQPTPAGKYHSLDARTGIEEIDAVLAAVESDDPKELRDLFNYLTIACMTANALGGPPPCREGEAEGTPVEVLPTLASEGSYLWKDEIGNWGGLDVTGLHAVFKVSETAYSDEYYPKGNYGVVLAGNENIPGIILQIRDGSIVRIHYILDDLSSALPSILERDASEMILAPLE